MSPIKEQTVNPEPQSSQESSEEELQFNRDKRELIDTLDNIYTFLDSVSNKPKARKDDLDLLFKFLADSFRELCEELNLEEWNDIKVDIFDAERIFPAFNNVFNTINERPSEEFTGLQRDILSEAKVSIEEVLKAIEIKAKRCGIKIPNMLQTVDPATQSSQQPSGIEQFDYTKRELVHKAHQALYSLECFHRELKTISRKFESIRFTSLCDSVREIQEDLWQDLKLPITPLMDERVCDRQILEVVDEIKDQINETRFHKLKGYQHNLILSTLDHAKLVLKMINIRAKKHGFEEILNKSNHLASTKLDPQSSQESSEEELQFNRDKRELIDTLDNMYTLLLKSFYKKPKQHKDRFELLCKSFFEIFREPCEEFRLVMKNSMNVNSFNEKIFPLISELRNTINDRADYALLGKQPSLLSEASSAMQRLLELMESQAERHGMKLYKSSLTANHKTQSSQLLPDFPEIFEFNQTKRGLVCKMDEFENSLRQFHTELKQSLSELYSNEKFSALCYKFRHIQIRLCLVLELPTKLMNMMFDKKILQVINEMKDGINKTRFQELDDAQRCLISETLRDVKLELESMNNTARKCGFEEITGKSHSNTTHTSTEIEIDTNQETAVQFVESGSSKQK